jgi:hypothetical protein
LTYEIHFTSPPENSSKNQSKPNQKAEKSVPKPKANKKAKKERPPHIITGFTILPNLQNNVRDVMFMISRWGGLAIHGGVIQKRKLQQQLIVFLNYAHV